MAQGFCWGAATLLREENRENRRTEEECWGYILLLITLPPSFIPSILSCIPLPFSFPSRLLPRESSPPSFLVLVCFPPTPSPLLCWLFFPLSPNLKKKALLKLVVFFLISLLLLLLLLLLSSPQSRPTHPLLLLLQLSTEAAEVVAAAAAVVGGWWGGDRTNQLRIAPSEGDALRQRGTRFTSADTHSDTKTPGSGLFASSLALSPRLCCQTGE